MATRTITETKEVLNPEYVEALEVINKVAQERWVSVELYERIKKEAAYYFSVDVYQLIDDRLRFANGEEVKK